MADSESRGQPVREVVSVEKWVRSRKVKISVRWLKSKKQFEVTARRNPHHIRVLDSDLAWAFGVVVDTMNDMLHMRPDVVSDEACEGKFVRNLTTSDRLWPRYTT